MTTEPQHGDEAPAFVVSDRRKVDPVTGEVRMPTPPAEPSPETPTAQPAPDASAEVAELTDRLQRLAAEYANYRRRTDRERESARDVIVAGVLTEFLPVLDDIGRARAHGDLDGTFRTVAEAIEGVVNRLGLSRFGEVGDTFDPAVHEAFAHATTDVPEGTSVVEVVAAVFESGWRIGDRVVRAARVSVEDRAADATAEAEPVAPEPPTATPHIDTRM